jgi:hypothetical protein
VVIVGQVNIVGEKIVDPVIHMCETCSLPILLYGRVVGTYHYEVMMFWLRLLVLAVVMLVTLCTFNRFLASTYFATTVPRRRTRRVLGVMRLSIVLSSQH